MAYTNTVMRRLRQERTEVNNCIKYLLFAFNSLIWVVGVVVLGVGIWALVQKGSLDNISMLTNKLFDPVLLLIVVGLILFFVGFFGCIGALRENILLLSLYVVMLCMILLLIIIGAIIVFALKDWLEDRILDSGVKDIIKNYRDDLDLKNLVDWIQSDWLQCCGLERMEDWQENVYFNCSSPGVDACGVPYSCCRPQPKSVFQNTQCGNAVLRNSVRSNVHSEGCLGKGKQWFSDKMVAIAGSIVAVCFVLLLGICCSWNLRADVMAQKAKWRKV